MKRFLQVYISLSKGPMNYNSKQRESYPLITCMVRELKKKKKKNGMHKNHWFNHILYFLFCKLVLLF